MNHLPTRSAGRRGPALWLAAAALACITTQAQAADLPPGVSCKVTALPAKTAAQKAFESLLYGKWESFDELDVQLDGLPQPEPSSRYRVLSKRPGQQPATDRPLILLLHGFPEFSWAWEGWLKDFGAQRDTIAIDLKGYGYSSKPVPLEAYALNRLTQEIDDLVECLGYKQVVPVGHDWGAGIAWAYAINHPQRTKGLVILSTPHPYTFNRELSNPDSEQRQKSHYIETIREPGSAAVGKFLAEAGKTGGLPPGFYAGLRTNKLFSANMSTTAKWERMFSLYRSMDFPPKPEDFPAVPSAEQRAAWTVKAPTLVFWGKADPYFSPKSWEGVEAFVPNLDFRAVEGAGHWINHDRPELPAQVMGFINKVAP